MKLKTKATMHVTADYADGTSKANITDRETLISAFSAKTGSPIIKMFHSRNPIVCITITRADILAKCLNEEQNYESD